MTTGILGTALSGLAAFQRSLETTSNNISNVNTEGYSRQRAELATRPEQFTGAGYIGNGVDVVNITRSYDQFITNQVRSSTSAFNEVDSFHSLSARIDNITADDTTGLAPAMKSFFNAVNDVANDPSAIAPRQVMLTQAESLTQQFNTMSARFSDLRKQVNDNLSSSVDEVNGYAKSIAELNVKIVSEIGRSSGKRMPNDLLDQRDQLLTKIAEKVDVSYVSQPDGSINVFIGNGQSLVLGDFSATLALQGSSNDEDFKHILLNGQDVSRQLSGGEINGNLRFRDQVLDPAQQQLGLLATGLATEFNNIHAAGFDLSGPPAVTGANFFNLGSPSVQVKAQFSDPTLSISTTYVTPSSAATLGAAYRLDVTSTGPDTFSLTNLSDNSTTTGLDSATLTTLAATQGFSISFGVGALTTGDTFEISPNFNAAASLRLAIGNPRQIAAASAANLPGDNTVALQLADLESQTKMFNNKASFNQVYGQLVADVGSQTHTASVGRNAQETLLKQATSAKENVSGVNLDEEAANLIKFQNSYQAAARAISVANSLFDALIGAVR